ncbi:IS200/IS605 family transposase [Telluribacter sp.]|jgi:REP element-mobilizing transposase RayT|uniref:IS200/IS605 family transposase n=1 Tax=Telluribacter sp. TaxID=1978767 RepID=UPI002E100726|nr:IS200/IS605 family transposase [Telluribacter sp.]
MANTYSQLYIQIVFAVKGRVSLVRATEREALEKYICGIVEGVGQKVMVIYCMPDHTHLFLSLKPDARLSDVIRDVKAGSSKWMNENNKTGGRFAWQEGYGAFSYAKSQKEAVIHYILKQPEHHRIKTFREEYLDFLNKFEIEYNEKFLFEWVEA